MSSTLDNLKSHLRSYTKIDDDLQNLNKKVYDLRSERRNVESQMISILESPEFDKIDKIKLSEDNSFVKIQRPGWNKPWNISKKDLGKSVDSYFASTSNPTSEDCYRFIIDSQRDKLTSTDFSFTRVKND